jgi:hypothetical protein
LTRDFSILSFTGVQSTSDFDRYINSNSGFAVGTCTSWIATTPIRLASTFICGYAVFYSTTLSTTLKCNTDVGTFSDPQASPMSICQTSAKATTDDVIAALKTNCPNDSLFGPYSSFVSNLSNTNCFLGLGQDVGKKCGKSTLIDNRFPKC